MRTSIDLQWVTDIKFSKPQEIKIDDGRVFTNTAILFLMEDGSQFIINAMSEPQQPHENNAQVTIGG